MPGIGAALRRCGRVVYPLLAASWTAVLLLDAGCAEDPKHVAASAGTAGSAGAHAAAAGGGTGGTGGTGGRNGTGGEAGVADEAGASGSLADAGMAGVSDDAGGASGAGTGADAGAAGAPPSSAGSGGALDSFSEPCPSSTLEGWASVAGLEFDPAQGLPAALEVSVSNATDLVTYAASPDPYVIHVTGTITVPVLDVTSNKVIVGDDRDATIEGGIRIAGSSTAAADMISNVVIRNLHINALSSATSSLPAESDGIGIAYAHHVWIDHVDVWDAPGDGIDITNGSDYVSISWSQFRFVDGARRTGVRVGNSDTNSAEDTGRLKVTLHHNFFTDSVDQRMPRVRFGDVHVFDNYFSHLDPNSVNSYCVAAAINSRLLVENNYFDEVQNPHVFFSFDSTTNMAVYSEPTAQMVASGNTYVGRADDPSGKQSGQGDSFTPPYSVVLEPADAQLKAFVRHCTGPLTPTAPGP